MERSVDALGRWRAHEVWRRELVADGASGAVDPVGTTWRDRPTIEVGDGRFLAGDSVAAPGMLSEVSVNSGVRAAQLALRDRQRRQWAPGWPAAELTPTMRASVLAAALPGATVRTVRKPWTVEPVTEVAPGRTVIRGRRSTRIASQAGEEIVTVDVPRRG
jgi:hypothetical protein